MKILAAIFFFTLGCIVGWHSHPQPIVDLQTPLIRTLPQPTPRVVIARAATPTPIPWRLDPKRKTKLDK